jgi:peroxiredoxin
MVEVGQEAPEFTLKGAGGDEFTLSSARTANNVLLMFYPRDMTSG